MFRAARRGLSPVGRGQLVVGGLACLLLLTTDSVVPQAVEADTSRSQLAALGKGQLRASAAMHRIDRKITRLRERKERNTRRVHAARKRLERQLAKRDAVRRRGSSVIERYELAALQRDRLLLVRPNPAGVQVTDRPRLRRQVKQLRARSARHERTTTRLERKVERTRRVKQQRARAVLRAKRELERKIERRIRLESVLGGRISQTVRVAQAMAARAGWGPAGSGFRRPAKGRISQGYGCQVRRKGRCGHFHDGIDIAAPRGTPVRAAASGYVAYVGWNPWDGKRRAYIVIIGHAGGYETVYGHLLPVRKVRPGQAVRRGALIGLIGSTGRSTGPHLHWEVSRGFRTLDPRSVRG